MPSRAEIKNISSLRLRKWRDEHGLFVVEGEKLVREGIAEGWSIQGLYSTEDFEFLNKKAEKVSLNDMERMSLLNSSSPCLAVVQQKKNKMPSKLEGHWIVLDGLSDPGNLGTIIRTAEWFGMKGVFCAGECVELYNPKVVQSTMGSIFRQNVVYGTRQEFIGLAKKSGTRLIGASMDGVSSREFVFEDTDVIVIGNESHGISEELLKEIDHIITIPGRGKAESLNASVAAAILMSNL
jgi:TrmH family RNA methyltransferase